MLAVEFHVMPETLIVKGIEHYPSRVIGRVAGPFDGPLTVLPGVASEIPLGDPSFGGAAERDAHMFQLVDCPRRISHHDLDGILITQVIAALDRIEEMPLPLILFLVAEGGGDASLGRPRMGTGGQYLAHDRDVAVLPASTAARNPASPAPTITMS